MDYVRLETFEPYGSMLINITHTTHETCIIRVSCFAQTSDCFCTPIEGSFHASKEDTYI